MVSMSSALQWLGGAAPEPLAVRKDLRPWFATLGLASVTAAVWLALSTIIASHSLWAVPGSTPGDDPGSMQMSVTLLGGIAGVLLGIVYLRLVRTWLSLKAVGDSLGRHRWVLLPLALLILALTSASLVALPLTVFQSEVAAQVKEDQDAEIDAMRSGAADSQTAKDLADMRGMIAEKEGILKGQVSGLSSPELDQARTKHDNAVAAREQAEKDRDRAHLVMICEKEGAGANPQCHGLASQRAGEGPLFAARQREYNQAVTKVNAAQTAEQTALREMEAAQTTANEANQDIVDAQQAQANLDLCGAAKDEDGGTISPPQPDPACQGGLRAQEEQLQTKLAAMQNGDQKTAAGVLAHIEAYWTLVKRSPTLLVTSALLAALSSVVIFLPLIVSIAGGRAMRSYAAVVDLLDRERSAEIGHRTSPVSLESERVKVLEGVPPHREDQD